MCYNKRLLIVHLVTVKGDIRRPFRKMTHFKKNWSGLFSCSEAVLHLFQSCMPSQLSDTCQSWQALRSELLSSRSSRTHNQPHTHAVFHMPVIIFPLSGSNRAEAATVGQPTCTLTEAWREDSKMKVQTELQVLLVNTCQWWSCDNQGHSKRGQSVYHFNCCLTQIENKAHVLKCCFLVLANFILIIFTFVTLWYDFVCSVTITSTMLIIRIKNFALASK